MSPETQQIIDAISLLRERVRAYYAGESDDLTPSEYALFVDLADWYEDHGKVLVEKRRQEHKDYVERLESLLNLFWGLLPTESMDILDEDDKEFLGKLHQKVDH